MKKINSKSFLKIGSLLLLLSITFFSMQAYANKSLKYLAQNTKKIITPSDKTNKNLDQTKLKNNFYPNQSFGLDVGTEYYQYEEPGVMKLAGLLYVFNGHYSYHSDSNLMLSASLEFSLGGLHYDGSTKDIITGVTTPHETNTFDLIVEPKGLIGYDFVINSFMVVTPFTGAGFRYLYDNSDDPSSYRRDVLYFYIPIGFQALSKLGDKLKIGLNFEFDFFCKGLVYSQLSDVSDNYNDLENDQNFGSGYGLKGSILVSYELTKKFGLSFEPFIKYWNIDNSDYSPLYYGGQLIGWAYEPYNTTISGGLKINFIF